MSRFIARRLLQGLVLICLVATAVFFLGRLTGNPVDLMLPEDATPEDRAAMIKTLGLDGPLHSQFLIFVGKALQGDLGMSIRMRQPAVDAFFSRLPNTLAIIPWAILLAMSRRHSARRDRRPQSRHTFSTGRRARLPCLASPLRAFGSASC